MSLLNKAGSAKPLDDLGIKLYGYIESGYMYDFSAPDHNDGPTFLGYHASTRIASLSITLV